MKKATVVKDSGVEQIPEEGRQHLNLYSKRHASLSERSC